jgi:hypothetical protein
MVDARSPLALNIIGANPHAYAALTVDGPTPPEVLQKLYHDNAARFLSRIGAAGLGRGA